MIINTHKAIESDIEFHHIVDSIVAVHLIDAQFNPIH